MKRFGDLKSKNVTSLLFTYESQDEITNQKLNSKY